MIDRMKPPLFVRPLTEDERAALRAGLRSPDAFTLRRRSEEHTSELQSHHDLVCRPLLEKSRLKVLGCPRRTTVPNGLAQINTRAALRLTEVIKLHRIDYVCDNSTRSTFCPLRCVTTATK